MKLLEILLIEDNPADAMMATEAIRDVSASNHVTIKSTAEEAMAFLRDPQPTRTDLIFMDLHLPGKGGLEVMAELQEDARLKNIPVILLAGSIDTEEEIELKKYSVFEFLLKPLDLDGYISRMKAILENFH